MAKTSTPKRTRNHEMSDEVISNLHASSEELQTTINTIGELVESIKDTTVFEIPELLSKLAAAVGDAKDGAEFIGDELCSAYMPEPEYDEREIDEFVAIKSAALEFVNSRKFRRPEEPADYAELLRSLGEYPQHQLG